MPGLLVVAAIAIIAIAIVQYQVRQRRKAELASVARRMRMRLAEGDPFDTLALDFGLFGKGDGRGIDCTMWGDVRGRPLRLFEYWYYDETHDQNHMTHRSYSRFTCALGGLAIGAPGLRLTPEGILSSIADHIGLRDIEFESEDFNRTFNVRCDDPRFASAVVDPRMMEWLMAHRDGCNVEMRGPNVLVTWPRISPREFPALAAYIVEFLDHIPPVALDLFPPGGPA